MSRVEYGERVPIGCLEICATHMGYYSHLYFMLFFFLFVGDSRGVLLFCIWMYCKYQQLVLAGSGLSETVRDGKVYNISKA